MNLELLEYKYSDGQWNVKDSGMRWIFSQMINKEHTFYNVDTNHYDPLDYFKRCRTFLCFIEGNVSGLLWVSSWNRHNASGFFNFSWLQCHPNVNLMGQVHAACKGLRMLLDMSDFKTLYAETSENRAAVIAFAQYMGFVRLGTIPQAHWHHDEQKWYNTVFMYVTKDTVRR